MDLIPVGFEECEVLGDSNGIVLENIDKKHLALITVPEEFDGAMLKGMKIVMNGSMPIAPHDSNDVLNNNSQRWQINTRSVGHKQQSNVVFLSNEGVHCFGPAVSLCMNVVEDLTIPYNKPPKRKKRISHLELPQELSVRWKPFGSGNPVLSAKSQNILASIATAAKQTTKALKNDVVKQAVTITAAACSNTQIKKSDDKKIDSCAAQKDLNGEKPTIETKKKKKSKRKLCAVDDKIPNKAIITEKKSTSFSDWLGLSPTLNSEESAKRTEHKKQLKIFTEDPINKEPIFKQENSQILSGLIDIHDSNNSQLLTGKRKRRRKRKISSTFDKNVMVKSNIEKISESLGASLDLKTGESFIEKKKKKRKKKKKKNIEQTEQLIDKKISDIKDYEPSSKKKKKKDKHLEE